GNPYASAIDADRFLQLPANAALMNGTIYFWTHNTPITSLAYNFSDYAVYTLLGGTGTMAAPNVGVNNTIPNGKIASGQGFFVVGKATGAATFNNSMRLTGMNTTFFKPAKETLVAPEENAAGLEKHRIWLDMSSSQGLFKQALVGYAQGATNQQDEMFDGPMPNGGNALSFYSLIDSATTPFAIQARVLPFATEDTVRLGYSTSVVGNLSVSLEGFDGLFDNQPIFLEDKVLNVLHNLKNGPYAFSTLAGTFNDRFELRYTDQLLSTPDHELSNSLVIAVDNRAVKLKSSGENIAAVTIYDLLGRIVYDRSGISTTDFTIENIISSQQSLIVKATLDDGTIVTRKILY
ncbi:MAG: T9SS sorting signal type C domain-containing protein, partial [Proteobacteria bacterium]